jgi:hypothetical protein
MVQFQIQTPEMTGKDKEASKRLSPLLETLSKMKARLEKTR